MTIGDGIVQVKVVRLDRNYVHLGIEAPSNVPVYRTELFEAYHQEQQKAALQGSDEASGGTATSQDRPALPLERASNPAVLSPLPAYQPTVKELFDGDPATRAKAAKAFGYYHARSPVVEAFNALQAALRQEQDPSLRAVFAKAIQAIAGKPFLAKLLRSIKRRERKASEQPTSVPAVPPKEETVKALFTDLSDGHETRISELDAINRAYRQELAERLAPAVNAHVQAMPHDTYEEKKALAKWVNEEVEPFGLAVKCPKTGLPAKLRAQTGNWPGIGRFTFEVYIDGKRTTPSASDKLPELQLTDATPPRSPSAPDKTSETPWQDEVGPKSGRRGRRLS